MELPPLPPLKGVFVTGTDTGVGKTWIAAGLTAVLRQWGLKAVYFKPVQSGCPEENGRLVPTDARLAQELAGLREPLELLTPIALRLPLAPGVAAPREGVQVDLEKVAAAIRELAGRYEFLVVEGAGGLYVPLIGTRFLVLNLVPWLRLPLLVVARAGLGTINHTALTVMAARQNGLPVAGVILNRYPDKPSLAEETNPEVIEAITEVPVLGKIPEVADLESPAGKQTFLAAMDGVCRNLAQACAARAFLECMIER
ncbi:MAG: dethiobiotin synthase [Desulfobaccales bacterium]|nr:dethiobiotin synthase [Desulfobaccales bacterium]